MKTSVSLASLMLAVAVVACKKNEATPTPAASETAVAKTPVAAEAPAEAPAEAQVKEPECPEGMAALPAGSFKSKRRGQAGVEVKVDALCLDRTEVTVAAYEACAEKGDCPEPDDVRDECNWLYDDPDGFSRKNHPINCMSAAEAEAYCEVLGKRLPSANEFEWAQRGGPKGTVYPWGDDAEPRRVCSTENKNPHEMGVPTTCAVGSCPAGDSPQGIHDLAGGVSEWTSTAAGDDSRWTCGGITSCEDGSVNAVDENNEAGSCTESQPEVTYYQGVGFRCAKSLSE